RSAGSREGASLVTRQVFDQRLQLGSAHHRAERLGHDAGKLFVTLSDRRRGIEDFSPDRVGIAPRAHVSEIGGDHLPLTVELVGGETPRRLDNLVRIRVVALEPESAREGGSPPGSRAGLGCLSSVYT